MKLIDKCNRDAKRYLNTGTYQNLQRTNTWKAGRAEVMRLRKVNNKCERCGRGTTQLFMHHEKYNFENIFDIENIRFICRKCNARVHYRKWTK